MVHGDHVSGSVPPQACCQEAQATRCWGIAQQALLQLHQVIADLNDGMLQQALQQEGGASEQQAQVGSVASQTLPAASVETFSSCESATDAVRV